MKNQKRNKIKTILHVLVLLIFTIVIIGSTYLKIFFGNESIEELLFYLTNGAANGDMGVYFVALKVCLPFFVAIFFILISLFYNILIDKKIYLKLRLFKSKKRKIKLYPINFVINHKIIFTIVYVVVALVLAVYNLQIFTYSVNNFTETTFIEDNYVAPKSQNIQFNEKRNLIYIYVESLETTFFTKEQGGEWDKEVMPELYDLLYDQDSTFFSHNEKATGMKMAFGSSWTTAGIVGNSTGLPFKVPIGDNEYHSENFMNGAYAIGDILKDNGYYNEVISGATTSFGGIKEFYTKHGQYEIVDMDSLHNYGFNIKESDKGPWGFNDDYLFRTAKQRLETISKNNQPFNMTLITIDTHPTDGFVGNYTLNKYSDQYENVYATTSKLIYDFVNWVKSQEYYKDTTIIIVGDHLNMQANYFKNVDGSNRYIYNVIINSAAKTKNTKNRTFTSFDMYPTTLASLGADIKDDRLGLGVNLYSYKRTLPEKYGFYDFDCAIKRKSQFYNNYILGSDYLKMLGDFK